MKHIKITIIRIKDVKLRIKDVKLRIKDVKLRIKDVKLIYSIIFINLFRLLVEKILLS